jgi:hypothetical protein
LISSDFEESIRFSVEKFLLVEENCEMIQKESVCEREESSEKNSITS